MAAASMLTLSGCGAQFPDMTQEEYDQTVQFAVYLLMKHSNNAVERLALVTPRRIRELDEDPWAIVPEEDPWATPEDSSTIASAASSASSTSQASSSSTQSSSASAQATEGDSSHEQSSAAESSTRESTTDSSETESSAQTGGTTDDKEEQETAGGKTQTESETHEEGDGTDTGEAETGESGDEGPQEVTGYETEFSNGMELSYTGYSVTSSYPDEGTYAYTLDADAGKKLLILSFKLSNMTDRDQEVDMIKANPHFQILVNGKNLGYSLVTVLENDLSSYKGTIPAGSRKTLILAIQVDANTAKSIESLGMVASMNGVTDTYIIE